MTGKDLPPSFRAIRKHEEYYQRPSNSLVRMNNRGLLQGSSVSMKSSHAFKKTDVFSV